MKANPICRKCGSKLNDENWYPSHQKKKDNTCNKCYSERQRLWRKANPKKVRENRARYSRKKGGRPFNENRECASFLGVHIAERVLSHVFNDAKVMPYGYPSYDIICNRDKRIDIKSACSTSCMNNGNEYPRWTFRINHNTIADYFLCIAFDNRKDLNPLHAWLIPGNKINHQVTASIRPSTIHKWDEYRLDLTKILDCCNEIR